MNTQDIAIAAKNWNEGISTESEKKAFKDGAAFVIIKSMPESVKYPLTEKQFEEASRLLTKSEYTHEQKQEMIVAFGKYAGTAVDELVDRITYHELPTEVQTIIQQAVHTFPV